MNAPAGDRERCVGRWSKSCSASPGLWTMTIACGVAPWMSAERHGAVGGVVERALALDDDPVALRSASSTIHSTVPWTKSLITRSTATPQPSIIMPVWPVARRPPSARHERRPAQLERDRHLADRAVGADGEDHPLARAVRATDGRLVALGRPAVVDDRRPSCARPRRTPGRRRGTCAAPRGRPAPRDRVRIVARQASGSLPPVGAMPMSSVSARGQGQRVIELATTGMSSARPSHSRTLRPACVESITASSDRRRSGSRPSRSSPWWNPNGPRPGSRADGSADDAMRPPSGPLAKSTDGRVRSVAAFCQSDEAAGILRRRSRDRPRRIRLEA